MALLQDVLRSNTLDQLDLNNYLRLNQPRIDLDDSDEELINVISLPGTPNRSRPSSRPTSPKFASSRPLPGPLLLGAKKVTTTATTDPLKALPTDLNQRIFRLLSAYELARCALVSKKWSKSQTINYVWFQRYRRENFHDESLPPGKWSKRESKQNWRITYLNSTRPSSSSRSSGYSSPLSSLSGLGSGYMTPREIKEEKWRAEQQVESKPGKIEMRANYKEMGGRKSKAKTKFGGANPGSGVRDKGGWDGGESEGGW